MRSVLEHLTEAQNAHDAARMASWFAEDYASANPSTRAGSSPGAPRCSRTGPRSSTGVPDFHAELLALSVDGETEWGELDWRGRHADGSAFGMRGVIIAVVRDRLIAEARLYMEPVDRSGDDIEAAVERLYRPAGARRNETLIAPGRRAKGPWHHPSGLVSPGQGVVRTGHLHSPTCGICGVFHLGCPRASLRSQQRAGGLTSSREGR